MSTATARRPIGTTTRTRFTSVAGMAESRVMPRVGKLRLGIKETSGKGKEHPKEIDYFRCTPDEGFSSEEQAKLVESFTAVYGERPSRLHEVYLPSDDLEFTFPHPLQWWGSAEHGAKLLCEGNGVEATRLNYTTGEWEPRTCAQAGNCAEYNTKKCGLKARLRVFLPLVTAMGYWQIDTGSEIGTGNILEVTQHILNLFGQLRGIPFNLSREKEGITYEGKTTPHYILHLWAPSVTLKELKVIAANGAQRSIAAGDVVLVEPDPDVDVPEELVPESEQQPAADPQLLTDINEGFDALGTTTANRLVALNKFKGREPVLLQKIKAEIDERNAATSKTVGSGNELEQLL